ncbi:MAG: hypothetical protein OEZ10_13525 [Gammaproteobacteria bacterium]|nr:hypothetical protein [Gammaproteobacteria bacterium]
MKYKCRDCGYTSKNGDPLTSKCGNCGSIYIFAAEEGDTGKQAKIADKWRAKYERSNKIINAIGAIVVGLLLYGVLDTYQNCVDMNDTNCPRYGRMLLGFVKFVAMFFR